MEKYVDSCTGNLVTPYPNEDTRSYCMNWMPLIYENCTRMDEYQYRTEADRQSKSMKADFDHYNGGGYELRLRGHIEDITNKIKTLQNNNWIDNRTRALITEFAVYNAQVNLFGVVKIVGEFIGGGVLPWFRVEVIALTRQWDFEGYVTLACELFFILSTMYYVINSLGVLKELGAREFFRAAWNVMDVFTICLSALAIGLWLLKTWVVLNLTQRISKTRGNEYLSLEEAQTVNHWYEYTVSITVFTSLLKLCRLLR